MAGADLSDAERKEIGTALERRHGEVKVIAVEGNRRAVIVKTSADVASLLRGEGMVPSVGRKRLVPILTSGAVGKLKRRASEAAANGEVSER